MPQALTRCGSRWSATPGWSETRLWTLYPLSAAFLDAAGAPVAVTIALVTIANTTAPKAMSLGFRAMRCRIPTPFVVGRLACPKKKYAWVVVCGFVELRLTCDQLVTYHRRRGRRPGLQGARR